MTRAVGQQVEHLENDAEVLGAKAVAVRGRQRGDVRAEDLDTTGLRATIPHSRRGTSTCRCPRGRPEECARCGGSEKSSIVNENALRPGQANLTFDILMMSGDANRRSARSHRCIPPAHIMPARSMRGFARVTSNFVWPLELITLTSSFCAAANVRK